VRDGPPGLPRPLDLTPAKRLGLPSGDGDARVSDQRDVGEQREDPDVVVIPGAARPRSSGLNPVAVFAGALLLAAVTFGSSLGLLMRANVLTSAEETPTPAAAATTGARTATPTPPPVRVTAGPATAERLETGGYRVIFTWTLEGAREGDTALLRFSVGSRVISEQRGALDASVFAASTGRFTVATSQECSADGWSAELVSLRGVTPIGEPTSRAPGVTCR